MKTIADAGLLAGKRVNVGGLHEGHQRRTALRYVSLTEAEIDDLRSIAGSGASVSARDLPTAREVGLEELLRAVD